MKGRIGTRAIQPIKSRGYRSRYGRYRRIGAQFLKRWGWKLAMVILLAAIACSLPGIYQRVKMARLSERARNALETGDGESASIFARRVLDVNPNHLGATRVMARAAEASGALISLAWWRQVSKLEPEKLQNQLDWAKAALRFGDPALAEEALKSASKNNRNTAAFHDMAAQVNMANGDFTSAEAQEREAVRLEPKADAYQLGLATVQLHSADPAVREAARPAVERLAEKPELKLRALQALMDDAVAHKDWNAAVAYGKKLQEAPDAPFETRLRYLGLLQEARHPQFAEYLSWLQKRVISSSDATAALMGWMNTHHMALLAVDWSKTLPDELRSRVPVPQAIAGSYSGARRLADGEGAGAGQILGPARIHAPGISRPRAA